MRKIFTLSLVALSMGSLMAQPVAKKFEGTKKNFTDLLVASAPDRSQRVAVSMQPGVHDVMTPMLKSADRKPAANGLAFYDRGNTLELGISFAVGGSGAGWYSYSAPILFAQAYEAQLVSRPGNQWTSYNGTNSLNEFVVNDSILDYSILPSNGAYYAPKVVNRTSEYYYGKIGNGESGYAIIYSAPADEEPFAVGAHNSNDADGFYGRTLKRASDGVSIDTLYTYGSMNAKYDGWSSDQLIIDYGTMHGFVLESISSWAICVLGDGIAFPEGGELLATLTVTNGDDVTTYTSVITEDNYDADGQHLSFEFYDIVDGFEAAISPILDGDVILSISGFSTVNLGIVGAGMPDEYSDRADYHPSSFFVADMGDGLNAYSWTGMDAVVNLVGAYNFVGEYGTGAHYVEGEIPAEGGWAVSAAVDGQEYNDFDIECVWGIDDLEFASELPEWIIGFDFDEEYFETDGVIMFFFAADELPEGVEGRECEVVIETADGASRVTIHLVQGDPAAAGIEGVEADKADKNGAIYDLYGRQIKSAAEGQLYIQNGKIIRK